MVSETSTIDISTYIDKMLPSNICVLLVLTSQIQNHTTILPTLLENSEKQSDSYITNKFISAIEFPLLIETYDNITVNKQCTPSSFIVIVSKTSSDAPPWHKFSPHVTVLVVMVSATQEIETLWSAHTREAKYQDLCVYTWRLTRWPPADDAVDVTDDVDPLRSPHVTYEERSCRRDREIVFKEGGHIKALGFELLPYFLSADGVVAGIEVDLLKLITPDWPVDIEVRPMFSWDSILSDLEQHKADMGMPAVWQSRILAYDLDYLHPYLGLRSTFLVPAARLLPPETYVFQSLSVGVWLMILLAIVVISQVIRVIARWHERRRIDNHVLIALALFSINNTTIWRINSKLMRGVLLMWSFASLLLNTSYSAGFTSIEHVPPTLKPIDTFQDSLDVSLRCWSIGNFSQGLLRASKERTMMQFADNMLISDSSIPPGVCTGVDVLLNDWVFAGYRLTELDLDTLKVLAENVQSTYNVFAMAKHSPYFRDLDKRMLLLKEHGFVTYMLKKYSALSLYALSDFMRKERRNTEFTPMKLAKFQGVMYLLLVGLFLSVLCFCGELAKAKREATRPQRRRLGSFPLEGKGKRLEEKGKVIL